MDYIYAIYDKTAKLYLEPILIQKNDDVAIRTFTASIKEGTIFFDFPESYCLRKIGAWHNDSNSNEIGNTPIFNNSDLVEFDSDDFPFVIAEAKDIKEKVYGNENEV